MHLLAPEDYRRAAEVLGSLDAHLAVRSILAGHTPGRVYVDDPARPAAAFALTKHRHYLAGDPSREAFNVALARLYAEELLPEALGAWAPGEYVLHHAPGWERAIADVVLAGRHPIPGRRRYLESHAAPADWRARLPAEVTLRPVHAALLDADGLGHLDALREEVLSEAPTREAFLARCFGYCLLRGEEIVAWCLSEYNTGDRCEVGIETVAAYRRRGYATIVASALVEHALGVGIRRVGWHCWECNVASAATARKAGFGDLGPYPVFFGFADEALHLAVNGNERLLQGDVDGAIAWFERALATGRAGPWAYVRAASALAAAGREARALEALQGAIARGWRDVGALERDAHLAGLRASRAWQEMLEALQKPST